MVDLTPRRSSRCRMRWGRTSSWRLMNARAADAAARNIVAAVERTLRWAADMSVGTCPAGGSIAVCDRSGRDGPRNCAGTAPSSLIEMNFPGYAMGGLAVGEGFDAMSPGAGELVAPHAAGRSAAVSDGRGFPAGYRRGGRGGHRHVRLRDADAKRAQRLCLHGDRADPPAQQQIRRRSAARWSPAATAIACRTFTRGAIRHYFFAGEMLGPMLVSVHNIRFYQRLMADVRRAIGEGTFEQFRREDPRCRMGPPEKELEQA